MGLTLDGIKAKIKGETYLVLPDGRTTLCTLTLQNGFTANGTSACVNPNEFNIDLGRKYALEDAMREVFKVEAYLLMQKNYEHALWVKHHNEQEEKKIKESIPQVVMKTHRVRSTRKPATPKFLATRDLMVTAPHGFKKDGTPKAKPGRKTAK